MLGLFFCAQNSSLHYFEMFVINFIMKKHGVFVYIKMIVMMICAIVGVGFVSGAEIYQFYARFGKFAYVGILIFFLLLFVLINKILRSSSIDKNDLKMNNKEQITQKNTFLRKDKIKSILTNFNVLMVSSAMFAGLFSLLKNLFKHNYYFFGLVAILLVFLILYFGVHGLEKFDYFVISFIVFLMIYFLLNQKTVSNSTEIFDGVNFEDGSMKMLCLSGLFACIYVFMNIVQIQPILGELNVKLSNKKRCLFSLFFALSLSLLLLVFVRFLLVNIESCNGEMPFLTYFKSKAGLLIYVYVIGLIFALLSSLLSCLIGVKRGVKRIFSSNFLATCVSILLSMCFSLIGFSNFVSIVYPAIGVLNFIIFVFL